MSILDVPLRKLLQMFYADDALRKSLLRDDIRLDRKKDAGGTRSSGGDFYLPFWSDVKTHISGRGDLTDLVANRIQGNRNFRRLYPLLSEGILELLSAKLRWSNEVIEITPQSVHGNLQIGDLGAVVRIRDAIRARVGGRYTRVVYPYFSEEPALPTEGGRLGLWVMQQVLTGEDPNDMRMVDPLRHAFFSPEITRLDGTERAVFLERYNSLISQWMYLNGEM